MFQMVTDSAAVAVLARAEGNLCVNCGGASESYVCQPCGEAIIARAN